MRASSVALLCAVFALLVGYALQLWERVQREAEDDQWREYERARHAREEGEAEGYQLGKSVAGLGREFVSDAAPLHGRCPTVCAHPVGVPLGMEPRPMPVPTPGNPVC